MENKEFFSNQMGCKIIDGQLAINYKYGHLKMPVIKQQDIDLEDFQYLGFQNSRKFDERNPKSKTLGYFIADKKFEAICKRPWNYVNWIAQYKQTCTPDVSCYEDMSLDEQWYGVYLNRLIGVFWQSQALKVIPTIAWGNKETYEFCFSGIENGSVVAVSTIGTSKNNKIFMDGFIEMCKRIKPQKVICYCQPYFEMFNYADILIVEHEGTKAKREARYRLAKNQLSLFDNFELKVAI